MKKFRWTFLVYMAGDNDLDYAGVDDLKEMLSVGTSPDVRVVVQFDRLGRRAETARYEIPDRPRVSLEECPRQVIPETNTGDPGVLADFIAWGRKTYPADHLALVVWNHGDGWRPLDLEEAARRTRGRPLPKERLFEGDRPRRRAFRTLAGHRHALFLHPAALREAIGLAFSPLYIGVDEGSNSDALDTIELAKAITRGLGPNRHLDFLGFDACLMSQLEVAYEVRGHVPVIVGSEQTEPGSGWPYDRVLQRLNHEAHLAPEPLAIKVASDYVTSQATELGPGEGVTQSVLRTQSMDELAGATSKFGEALSSALKSHALATLGILGAVQRYDDPHYGDLGHLAKLARKNIPARAVASAADEVLRVTALVVAAHNEAGDGVGDSTGITVYLPRDARELRNNRTAYARLAISREFPGWLAFLDRLYQSTSPVPKRVRTSADGCGHRSKSGTRMHD